MRRGLSRYQYRTPKWVTRQKHRSGKPPNRLPAAVEGLAESLTRPVSDFFWANPRLVVGLTGHFRDRKGGVLPA
jgi:hypothetical protein